jgi:hypothetical protein
VKSSLDCDCRDGDLDYARRQMAKHAARNNSGVCHLDERKACAHAVRCGFQYRVECCASFAGHFGASVTRSHSVPTSCRACVRWDARHTDCDWSCVCQLAAANKEGGK